MQAPDPEERLRLYQKGLLLIALFTFSFIFTEVIYSPIDWDLIRIDRSLSELSRYNNSLFLGDVQLLFGNHRLSLSHLNLFHIQITLITIITQLGVQLYALVLTQRTRKLVPPPKRPLFEKLPESTVEAIRFHRLRVIACVLIGIALDYFMWFWIEVGSHLLSIQSLLVTLPSNPQFGLENGIGDIQIGESTVAFDLAFIFYFNIALVIFGYIVTLLFAGHLGRIFFLFRPPPKEYY